MRYVSTRSAAEQVDFATVVLSGVAADGGLYVPQRLPCFSPQEIANWSTLDYPELAFRVLSPFVGDSLPEADFKVLLHRAYSGFGHRAVAPLRQIDRNEWVLELFHGPTGSAKDFAARLQAQLVGYFLQRRQRHGVLVGASNGDTALAAIDAFKDCPQTQVLVFYPQHGVPEQQGQQLQAAHNPGLWRFAVQGSFDDCQTLVGRLLRQWPLAEREVIGFNSSNWVGVMAQLVLYFHAVLQLGGGQRPIGFSVPAASFAEVYAGYIVQKMGLPITQMIVATNRNDALHQLFQKNRYCRAEASQSLSPAMDLSLFANLERFVWELYGQDPHAVAGLMQRFEGSGEMTLDNEFWLQARMIIDSYSVSDEETGKEITSLYRDTGYIIDPHAAIGVLAARLYRRSLVAPMVTLGAIAPAKSARLLGSLGIPGLAPQPLAAPSTAQWQALAADDFAAVLHCLKAL